MQLPTVTENCLLAVRVASNYCLCPSLFGHAIHQPCHVFRITGQHVCVFTVELCALDTGLLQTVFFVAAKTHYFSCFSLLKMWTQVDMDDRQFSVTQVIY